MEAQTLYDSFTFKDPSTGDFVPIASPINSEARGTPLSMLICPTDNTGDNSTFEPGDIAQYGGNWARGNYACNGGNGALGGVNDNRVGNTCFTKDSQGWQNHFLAGVMSAEVAATLQEIEDGTSNTVLLTEIRAGITQRDIRGVWAWGTSSASVVAWHGWHEGAIGSANGPNNCATDSDDIPFCNEATVAAGNGNGNLGLQLLHAECATCRVSSTASFGGQAGARSQHAGGVFIALCDGSVHWASDNVETSMQCCSVWDRLIMRADGDPVNVLDAN